MDPIVPLVAFAPVEVLLDGNVSAAAAFAGREPIVSSTTYCIMIRWEFNNAGAAVFTDNVAQSDGFELDFDFVGSQLP